MSNDYYEFALFSIEWGEGWFRLDVLRVEHAYLSRSLFGIQFAGETGRSLDLLWIRQGWFSP